MKVQALFLAILMLVSVVSCIPALLGFGGVFNSPEANSYWERRFGRGFFSNLASIQKNINNQAVSHRAQLDKSPAVNDIVDLKSSVEEKIENDLNSDIEPLPQVLTPFTGPLFFEDVNI